MLQIELRQCHSDVGMRARQCVTVQAECVEELLAVITSEIADASAAEFNVTIAGNKWPTDVRTDLLTFLEQLKDTLLGLQTVPFRQATLDFYEQGIERVIELIREDDMLRVKIIGAVPEVNAKMPYDSFREMVRALWSTFNSLAEEWSPESVTSSMFSAWRSEVDTLIRCK